MKRIVDKSLKDKKLEYKISVFVLGKELYVIPTYLQMIRCNGKKLYYRLNFEYLYIFDTIVNINDEIVFQFQLLNKDTHKTMSEAIYFCDKEPTDLLEERSKEISEIVKVWETKHNIDDYILCKDYEVYSLSIKKAIEHYKDSIADKIFSIIAILKEEIEKCSIEI